MAFLRTILALARISLLPTVWSNCIAGWWLGGGGFFRHLFFVLGGGTLLFLGGAFLKDAFDADFDRQHHPDRPIPAGLFSDNTVYRVGLSFLTLGALLLLWPGYVTGSLGLFLVCLIILHHTTHRLFPAAPVLKGFSRLLLYLLGASVARRGIDGGVLWCALVLALYTSGVGYLAIYPAKPSPKRAWPVLLLAAPIALALIMDAGEYRETALLLSAVVALWALRSLRPVFWSPEPDARRSAAGLTAGIVFVDWLATCPLYLSNPIAAEARQLSFAFLALFGLTVLLQKLDRRSDPRSEDLKVPAREF